MNAPGPSLPCLKWAQVTIDLVLDLPEPNGFTAIEVLCESHEKKVYFTPGTKEVTVLEYAKIFVNIVFRLHGLPDLPTSFGPAGLTCLVLIFGSAQLSIHK